MAVKEDRNISRKKRGRKTERKTKTKEEKRKKVKQRNKRRNANRVTNLQTPRPAQIIQPHKTHLLEAHAPQNNQYLEYTTGFTCWNQEHLHCPWQIFPKASA